MRRLTILACALLLSGCGLAQRPLKVCADPNNLPFSNAAGQGFENRIAELIARELHRKLQYVWWAQRRGYVRNTVNAGRCDLWPGVAAGVDMMATTRPYYRSTYVFVTRADRRLDIASYDDPRLRRLRVGVQMVGADMSNTPPAHALARRGMVSNVRGYMLYGDYAKPNPPAAIVDAVARGDVDTAVVWGPLAGYFAARSRVPLKVTPVRPWLDGPQWPMVFDISMGVRRGDEKLRRKVEAALDRQARQIRQLLAAYHVPEPASP